MDFYAQSNISASQHYISPSETEVTSSWLSSEYSRSVQSTVGIGWKIIFYPPKSAHLGVVIWFERQDLNRRVQYFLSQWISAERLTPVSDISYYFSPLFLWGMAAGYEKKSSLCSTSSCFICPPLSPLSLLLLNSTLCTYFFRNSLTDSDFGRWQRKPSISITGRGTMLLVRVQYWRTQNSAALGRGGNKSFCMHWE